MANVVLHDLDLNFQGQSFKVAILTSKHYRYFLSNGANVVRNDPDIHFQGFGNDFKK